MKIARSVKFVEMIIPKLSKSGFCMCLLVLWNIGCIDQDELRRDNSLPNLLSIVPEEGYIYDTISLKGENLETVDSVLINGALASIVSKATNELKITVPPSANSGPVSAHNPSGYDLGPNFTVLDAVTLPNFTYTVSTIVGFTDNDNVGSPWQIVPDGKGNFYFTDPVNNQIKLLSAAGKVSVYAGTGAPGFSDGKANEATFNVPAGLDIDKSGNLYVADANNHAIRKIAVGGLVSTVAGFGQPGFVDGFAQQQAQFNSPLDVAIADNQLYISDFGNHAIRQLNLQTDMVITLAGNGQPGLVNDTFKKAMFNSPIGICLDNNNNLLVADALNHSIRLMDFSTNKVSIYMGTGSKGFKDGGTNVAQFNMPYDVGIDGKGAVYVADRQNHSIRKISNLNTTTIAGTGIAGLLDGNGDKAQFNNPYGLFVVSANQIWVCDYGNGRIRKIILE